MLSELASFVALTLLYQHSRRDCTSGILMEELRTSLKCVFCSRGVGKEEWTKSFYVVFLDGNQTNVGVAVCDKLILSGKRLDITDHRTLTHTNPTSICVLSPMARRTATDAFLVHLPCLDLLELLSGSQLPATKLFKLCQALQPDRERSYGFEDLPDESSCLDPVKPVVHAKTVEQWKNWRPVNSTKTLPLPPEVILMILECISSETLINFFCASAVTMSFAPLYFGLHLWHLFPSINLRSTSRCMQEIVGTVGHTFSSEQYLALDKRWKLLNLMKTFSDLIPAIHDYPTTPTWNMRSPLQETPHAYGLRRLIADIPGDVITIEIYSRCIRDNFYVCGLGWSSASGESLIGSTSEMRTRITFKQTMLYFIADTLGIKMIKFRETPWQPERTAGWEGLSIPKERLGLVIMADALKFRSISWFQTQDISFQETLIMRNHHASHIGIALEELYVRQLPECESDLIERHRYLAVESMIFNDDMHGITMYSNGDLFGIVGVHLHSNTNDQFVGFEYAWPRHFPLNGPAEVVTEIDVRTTSSSTSLKIRTNWGRQCLFGTLEHPNCQYTIQTLRPPQGHFIGGIYFRVGNRGNMESFGIICTFGSRGTSPPNDSYFPPLLIPMIPSEYVKENNYQFESGAAFSDLKGAAWYRDNLNARCIGLRLFYRFGGSEILGRAQGNIEREVIFSDGEAVCRIWILYRDGMVLEDIDFETTNTQVISRRGTSYEITETTCIAWWYSESKDIIRIYDPKPAESIE